MAREEADREDLLSSATALAWRVQLTIASDPLEVLAGFHRNGAASFYFGPDCGYQFNLARELRRAVADDLLYKAERGRLVALRRERSASSVELVRRELTAAETDKFLAALEDRLRRLRMSLEDGDYKIIGQVPPNADMVLRLRDWLAANPDQTKIADKPNVG